MQLVRVCYVPSMPVIYKIKEAKYTIDPAFQIYRSDRVPLVRKPYPRPHHGQEINRRMPTQADVATCQSNLLYDPNTAVDVASVW